MQVNELQIGDILVLHDKNYNLYRATLMVTEVDPAKNLYKVIQWRGVGFPFSITEQTLPSKEALLERNVEIHVFRIKDEILALRTVKILKTWLTWAVPYDKDRLKNAENSVGQYFGVSSDIINHVFPTISTEVSSQKLESHRKFLEELFERNIMDVVKYSSRRDTSPVRPRIDGSGKGFNCLQGILVALQAAFAQDYVRSITDKWVSNKNTAANSIRAQGKPIFEDVKTALLESFYPAELINKFPLFLRLYAKECSIDTFVHAMHKDAKEVSFIGVLAALKAVDIKPSVEVMSVKVAEMKELGVKKRSELLAALF